MWWKKKRSSPYQIDRDAVVGLADVPPASVGAPLPVLVANDDSLALAYLVDDSPLPPEGIANPRSVSAFSEHQHVAIVHFKLCLAFTFGPPNDEALNGHPLYARGLQSHGTFRIEHSSWIRQMEHMNRAHPNHDPRMFERWSHFIFTFHDSTLECLADGYSIMLRVGSLASALPELHRLIQHR
jgi:hypothetical protein